LVLVLALCGACARPVQEVDDSDPAIRARIENVIRGRKDLDLSHVQIDVYAHVVTVSGVVPSEKQQRAIMKLVDKIHGVDQAINNLLVQD
jgi:osmotically-inducible protein OsmY